MAHPEPADDRRTGVPWSPETETRDEVKALLLRRSALLPEEVLLFRALYPDIYDTYVETLSCVVRARGAKGAVEMELVHDALATFWDQTIESGFPDSLQGRLLSLASGLARNHVRRERRNPANQALPTSSKEAPGSFPKVDRALDLKAVCSVLFDRLSPEHQAVIAAVVLRDLTVKSAARELGLHRTTASSRLTAALALLGTWMEEMLSPSERGA
jgi:DNA-directed RNA polymerase specialized sigma24 family protein